ncbi:MAG: preprotein translocase subunit YajC [Gammaproteobacteria bacterium]|nr:preprotein translocase subunit YajC [Gammaproteobacteria bacterium]
MDFLIPAAMAQDAASTQQGNPLITVLMFAGLFLFMWLFIIRPQRKRQKEHTQLVSNLQKGDEVVTSSGMLGRIDKVDDDYIVLEVAEDMRLKFQKVAVHAVLPKGTIKKI